MKYDRLAEIKKILLDGQLITTEGLCKRFMTSAATIRRDLDVLEQEGLIKKVYGGAVPVGVESVDVVYPTWASRQIENIHAKVCIAKKVASLIPEHCTVWLDSGTTVYEIAKMLTSRQNLTVITSSLRMACFLGMYKNIQVFSIGGEVQADRLVSTGLLAMECLKYIPNIDLAIFSADGFDKEKGGMELSMDASLIKKTVMERTSKIILALDHSKFKNPISVVACPTSRVDVIVTDNQTPSSTINELRRNGLNVIIA